MKKIKDLWNNNRVLVVLCTIVIICFLIMGVVVIKYFIGFNSSEYGDRLEDIEGLPLKDEDRIAIENKAKENENVTEVSVHSQGKIIYVRIVFTNTSLDRAKEIPATTLEVINDEYKAHYDIHYTLVQEATDTVEGYTIMGAKNIRNNSTIIWNNNTPVTKEE